MNHPKVQAFLKARPGTKWLSCGDMDYYKPTRKGVYQLLLKNVRRVPFLFLSGNQDFVVPSVASLRWLERLKLDLKLRELVTWRKWFVGEAPDYRVRLAADGTLYE
jgi:hypothetical protein